MGASENGPQSNEQVFHGLNKCHQFEAMMSTNEGSCSFGPQVAVLRDLGAALCLVAMMISSGWEPGPMLKSIETKNIEKWFFAGGERKVLLHR